MLRLLPRRRVMYVRYMIKIYSTVTGFLAGRAGCCVGAGGDEIAGVGRKDLEELRGHLQDVADHHGPREASQLGRKPLAGK